MTAGGEAGMAGRRRWVVCGLLLLATGINYLDRQTIGLLKPTLQAEFGWTERAYADIVFWFQAAYAVGYLGFGAVIDRLGARLGYACAFVLWTIAHMLHGAVRSALGFGAVRFLLGLGESGNFPAGLRAVADWFPPEERAFATGVFNAGSNIGVIAAPLIVPAITLTLGWRAAFLITGAVSLLWLVPWLLLYRRPPAGPETAPTPAKAPVTPWRQVLGLRQAWAYAIAKALTDPVWWLFLFWLPDFLHRRYGLNLKDFGPPLVAVYLMSDVGSVAGGWLSLKLIRSGWTTDRARKGAMLLCALLVTPIFVIQYADSLWPAVAIIGLAAAAHQAWSANLMTLPSDMAPRPAVGRIIGLGGCAGAVGGMLMSQYTGLVLDTVHSYWPVFAVAGGAYLLALALVQLLVPRFAPTD
jgi:ACS family hexuronate transporter-like MFS transporter